MNSIIYKKKPQQKNPNKQETPTKNPNNKQTNNPGHREYRTVFHNGYLGTYYDCDKNLFNL